MWLNNVVAGLTPGATYAIVGVLLTLMSQLTRVVNFAQVAVGMFGGYISLTLVTKMHLPIFVGVIGGILVAALLSALLGWIIATWLAEASTSARSAVTVAALLFLISLAFILFGYRNQPFPTLVAGPMFTLPGGAVVSKVTVLVIGLAIVITVGSWAFLKFTAFGVKLRAVSDRQMAAELLGINVKMLNVSVWSITGAIAGLTVALVGPTASNDYVTVSTLVIPGAAAALVGAFKRMDLALVGGLAIGAIQGLFSGFPNLLIVRDWVPIIFIILFLLWNQRKEVWDVAR
ncbi:branched-chain amino acid ABC transporter permease [Alpinimonas psychrophila]|uniref:Branched-chain amino acid transport system permease protein n=1 Tax=Alpinimonas psychrophila TaxID=748908 RepID=A0A7W3JU13_9MICO|nr:branched-chain amino acid ABC transporter permease [Alpinimonas psychrophila]MBA8829130.1 branched-chain amino acid transport system permease protein [Alpinimonas psychrophila]